MNPPTRALRRLVLAYQHLRAGRPSPCRFVPTCSTYALEALEAHGAVRGSWYATQRVCRCHPWGGQGYDPVPQPAVVASERPRHHNEPA
jgi:putative membrane protein insertion efficiency factor